MGVIVVPRVTMNRKMGLPGRRTCTGLCHDPAHLAFCEREGGTLLEDRVTFRPRSMNFCCSGYYMLFIIPSF